METTTLDHSVPRPQRKKLSSPYFLGGLRNPFWTQLSETVPRGFWYSSTNASTDRTAQGNSEKSGKSGRQHNLITIEQENVGLSRVAWSVGLR